MKKQISTLITCLLIVSNGFAQWHESSFNSNYPLFEVAFPSPNAAYIAAEAGLVFKSTDAGRTWQQIYDFGPFSNLANIDFVNADTGFVSANNGVYRTIDGGDTWNGISATWTDPNGLILKSIKLKGNKIYSSVKRNDTSFLYRSDDYGYNWIEVFAYQEPNAEAFQFSMVDDMNGYFINPNELSEVLKTTDGGLSFSDTLLITNGPMVAQARFDFKDLHNGYWYASQGSASHPTRTWNTGTFYFPIDLDGFGVLPIYDLDFNTSKLYASSLYGKIFTSLNNGQYWTEQTTPLPGPIYSIAFANENQGIAISLGKVIYTDNGGILGINESDVLSSSITIYPNPSSGEFSIETRDLEILNLSITDLEGKIIESQNLPPNQIDISKFQSGIYFLHLETSKGPVTKKILVN